MSSIICERAFVFAVRVISVCERLCERGVTGRHLANQLLKAATSIGANAEEAQEGQTKPDFIAKMAVSRKESRETSYWLRLSVATGLVKPEHVKWELDEAEQLRRMIRAAIITAQSSDDRGDLPHR
jgi:four helix bundle protein